VDVQSTKKAQDEGSTFRAKTNRLRRGDQRLELARERPSFEPIFLRRAAENPV
jgi:hypothetical protein